MAFYLALLGPLGWTEDARYPSYRGTEEVAAHVSHRHFVTEVLEENAGDRVSVECVHVAFPSSVSLSGRPEALGSHPPGIVPLPD